MSALPAKLANLAAVTRGPEVTPSAAESVRCACGGSTDYDTDAIGRTVECCVRCGRRTMITGRVVPLELPRQGRRTDLLKSPEGPCQRCGGVVPVGMGKPRRFCDACKAIRLHEGGKAVGGVRYAYPDLPCETCGVMVPQINPPKERRRFCTPCRNAARTGRRVGMTVRWWT